MRLGWLELLVILGVVLLFFGPSRLPGLGNALGSAIRGFKRGISGHEEEPSGPEKLPAQTSSTTPQAPGSANSREG
ncbi:MAG: twin-arginine translocase TatA/TatE family subunit [Deltaproteobacteria bacterium]|nr:twin-arginine translocase TatA/TatE family subunit [Deltaproteobacteria bacterium]